MYYSDNALENLCNDLESDRVERKESWNGDAPEKGRQAVCAFANDLPDHRKPGVLFLGMDDHGKPTGLAVTDTLLQTLADIKTDGNILPPPSIIVQKRRIKGNDIVVVLVVPADTPPVRFKGRIWIRIGPRRGIATPQDERILNEKRRYRDTAFEMRPVTSARLREISRVLFEERYLPKAFAPETIRGDERTYEQQLAVCGMVETAEKPVPTAVGLLVLGHRPRFFIGGAYIQFLRFKGLSIADPVIDEKLIEGGLEQVARRIDEKIESHNRVQIDIVSQPLERRSYLYPLAALQQIVRNALMHRTYENTNAPVQVHWFDNRIEIRNPGGPFGAVNETNFGQPGIVDYRNPRIADAMKVLGLVQRFGIGIQTAQLEMARNGNPLIIFKVDSSTVTCILFPAPVNEPVNEPLNEPLKKARAALRTAILKEMRRRQDVSYDELAKILKRGRSTIMRSVRELKNEGLLHREGSDKTGKWVTL